MTIIEAIKQVYCLGGVIRRDAPRWNQNFNLRAWNGVLVHHESGFYKHKPFILDNEDLIADDWIVTKPEYMFDSSDKTQI